MPRDRYDLRAYPGYPHFAYASRGLRLSPQALRPFAVSAEGRKPIRIHPIRTSTTSRKRLTATTIEAKLCPAGLAHECPDEARHSLMRRENEEDRHRSRSRVGSGPAQYTRLNGCQRKSSGCRRSRVLFGVRALPLETVERGQIRRM